ncbi:MAG: spondin domain-containing protein [Lewinellaceae bacterium]|nr:spondin domain-containing protein [Phaeodactylibacter sp.]MCB0613363.1 spondin domain-containing protein [Phaeodactylibacter sp.]MCB9347125.1 spondin domain-containing protein [Lewinellaceae bacterium]
MKILKNAIFALSAVLFFSACNNDDEAPTPAESATFTVTIENTLAPKDYLASGATGLLLSGEQEQFTFHAGRGAFLNLATMFVQSNDLFYAFDEKGLELYDESGNAVTGDVTEYLGLWDAGTEVNEAPGDGPNQAPRQSGPNTGMDENGVVGLVNDGYTYPANESVIRVSLAHDGGTEFTLTLENISGSASLPTPLAPGIWAVHGAGVNLFETGKAASAGLEAIAEDGNNAAMVASLEDKTGYVSPFAPGVWAIHNAGDMPLFTNGAADRGEGLEALAEDGDPSVLNTSLNSANDVIAHGVFNTPEGATAPGPLMPGASYSFTFDAEEGAYLNLATMLVHTNDLFYAYGEGGLALFNNGMPVNGDITGNIQLWDAGTEVNEYPGAGNHQPARGGGDSGPDENGIVQPVNDAFTYPAVSDAIRVTIEAKN